LGLPGTIDAVGVTPTGARVCHRDMGHVIAVNGNGDTPVAGDINNFDLAKEVGTSRKLDVP
jgi:hypothetical protein